MAECEKTLEALLRPEGEGAVTTAIEAHLAACESCRLSAERWSDVEESLSDVAAEPPPPFERVERVAQSQARMRRRLQVARRCLPFTVALVTGAAVAASVSRLVVQTGGGAAVVVPRGVGPAVAETGHVDGGDAAETSARRAWQLLRAGDRMRAIEEYRRALALLPASSSPLWADSASAQLALLVERDDAEAGVLAWRDYLWRFPLGVHADVARERLARRASMARR